MRLAVVILSAIPSFGQSAEALRPAPAVVITGHAGGTWAVTAADLSRPAPVMFGADAIILTVPGRYRVDQFFASSLLTAEVVVGGTQLPPTPPKPPVPPIDPPAPMAATLYVTVVYEAGDLTVPQSRVLRDKGVQDWLTAGKHKYREIDQDVVDASGKVPADVAKHIQLAKQAGLPCVVVTDESGAVLAKLPVPDSGAKLLAELKGLVKTGAKR
jgi:hypothetical protein